MKVPHRRIEKGGEGQVSIIPEEPDDLWCIYNLICKNDQVRASTWRKVVNESSTGSTNAQRIRITISVSVERVEYDSESNKIKIKGRTVEEHKHVRRGQYHTLELELNKKFYLTKPVWDKLSLAQLDAARDVGKTAEVAVVMMQEGLAYVCVLTTNMTVQKAKIETNIPRKRKNFCSQHQKGMTDFFEQIMQAILRHINFEVIKCIIVASPGFVKDQFMEYFWQQATKLELKPVLESRSKFLLTHSSTGFKHSIREILSDPQIQPKLEDTKAAQEIKIWNKFQDLLSSEPNKAVYGLRDVEMANHYEAISCMVLSDMLFRSNNLSLRKKYSQLMEQVRKYGAEVRIFSSMHLSGQQLNQLTGIAAILKFEVPELSAKISAGGSGGRATSGQDDADETSSTSSSSTSSSASSLDGDAESGCEAGRPGVGVAAGRRDGDDGSLEGEI